MSPVVTNRSKKQAPASRTSSRRPAAPATGSAPAGGPAGKRTETDSMGSMEVPADALYGATTQRAVLNFPISGRTVPQAQIEAHILLKRCCAEANLELKELGKDKVAAIVAACDELLGSFADRPPLGERHPLMRHFPIDVYQTGSGTSTNMNVNEVIGNVASRQAGKPIGAKEPLHPNDHVNYGQSSNDTFPASMQIAGAVLITRHLIPSLEALSKGLWAKAKLWDKIVKIGRTHLMDATPIRVGQEFSGYAAAVDLGIERARKAVVALASDMPIGGTAVGTGINANVRFGRTVCERLSKSTGIAFREAKNHFEAQATRDCCVEASGHLKTIAVSLSKIANDIRWLGSGPRCGLFELSLPATQPGSSIMPGKVNPVICESVMMVACQVIGNDAAITTGGLGGVGSLLELNVAMPVIAERMIESIEILANACTMFLERCVSGLELNLAVATGTVEKSLMMCTSLAPVIGYDNAAKVAKEAFKTGETVREYVTRNGLVDPKRLATLLDATSMTKPGGKGPGGG
ncbi:MAG: class II fumarate hydratase [Phycisphaerae bacterium]|jgi:fumarate hydratase class II|nr:class II fumarate hydratase [Phycisphaerae bacterium]